jgi:hypothetical protein
MKKVLIILGMISVFTFAAAAQRVGGYKPTSTSDKRVQIAAAYAAKAEAERSDRTIKVISINKAEMQLVQGRNYRLCLNVESSGAEDEADAIFFVEAVVYSDLKDKMRLVKWTPAECQEDDED